MHIRGAIKMLYFTKNRLREAPDQHALKIFWKHSHEILSG